MRGVALFLVLLVLSGPLVSTAHAASAPGAGTNDLPWLRRTNQVLSAVIAFLKLCDEISQLPDPGDGTPLPPPIGTGHPGPGPGPLPSIAPWESATS